MLVGNGHKKNCEHHVRVIAFPLFLTALPADNRCKLFTQSRPLIIIRNPPADISPGTRDALQVFVALNRD